MLKVLSCELDTLSLADTFVTDRLFLHNLAGELHQMLNLTVRIQQVFMCLKCNGLVKVNKIDTTIE